MSDLTQLRQEEKTVFQNKMIQVVYLMGFVLKQKGLHHYLAKKNQSRLKNKRKDRYGLI